MNKEDIDPKNNKGEFHGYQEWYTPNGKIWTRAVLKNDEPIHYGERHEHKITEFYIK
jgi:hypothetical protein